MPKNARTLLDQATDVVKGLGAAYKTYKEVKDIFGKTPRPTVSIKDPNHEHWYVDGKDTGYLVQPEFKRGAPKTANKESKSGSSSAVQVTLPTQTGLQMVSADPFQFKSAPKLKHNPDKVPAGVRVKFNGYLSDMINKTATNYSAPGGGAVIGWGLNPCVGISGSNTIDSILAGSSAAQGMAKAFRRYRCKYLRIEFVACCPTTTPGCLTVGYISDSVSAAVDAVFQPTNSAAFATMMGQANSVTISNTIGGSITVINEIGSSNDIDDLFYIDGAHDSTILPLYRQSQQGCVLAYYDGLAPTANVKTHMARYTVVFDFYEPTSRSATVLIRQKIDQKRRLIGYQVDDGKSLTELKVPRDWDPRTSVLDPVIFQSLRTAQLFRPSPESETGQTVQDMESGEDESDDEKAIVVDPPYTSVRKPRIG
jgi:hypothetical protein